jgi:hypothetical protein
VGYGKNRMGEIRLASKKMYITSLSKQCHSISTQAKEICICDYNVMINSQKLNAQLVGIVQSTRTLFVATYCTVAKEIAVPQKISTRLVDATSITAIGAMHAASASSLERVRLIQH